MGMGIEWTGLDELTDALAEMVGRVTTASPHVVEAIGELMQERTRSKLHLTEHERGTPTPAAPGTPPSFIGGYLQGSVTHTPVVPTGDGVWSMMVGGTAVYARIQELGGWAGRDHASHLPPRPYLRPAYDELIASGEATEQAANIWGQALLG